MDHKKPAERLNWVDRAVSFVNPEAGLRRMAARQVLHTFGYNDRPERRGDSGGIYKNAASENWYKSRDSVKAMWDARDLCQYDWIGGTLARITLYVVGTVRNKANTGDESYNAIYDNYWSQWAGESDDDGGQPLWQDEGQGAFLCDYTCRHNLTKLLQMGHLGMYVDGDHGYVLREDIRPSDISRKVLRLVSVEGDCIGSPIEALVQENYIRGITVDPATKRVEHIRVFSRTRIGQYVDPVEVDPENFLHLWDPRRVDQYRGHTALYPILNDIRDIREWDEAEMLAGKTQAQWAAIVGTRDPYATRGAGAWDNKTTEGTPTQNAQWGKILKAAEGETFSLLAPPTRPSGAYMAFIQAKLKKIAAALGYSFGFVWDMSMLGGVSQRIELRSDERRIEYEQRNIVTRVLRQLRRAVLSYGVAFDGLPAHPHMHRSTWRFGDRLIVDAGYEVQNDLALLGSGLASADDVAAKYNGGEGLRSVARHNVSIIEFLRELAQRSGMPIELITGNLFPNASAQLAAMNTPPPAPPAPGTRDALGDKGAQEVIDILQSVASGQMDRDSAIATLVSVYQVPTEQAQLIVPFSQPPTPNPSL